MKDHHFRFPLSTLAISHHPRDAHTTHHCLYLPPSIFELHPKLQNAKIVMLLPASSSSSETSSSSTATSGANGGVLASLHRGTESLSTPCLKLAEACGVRPSWAAPSPPPPPPSIEALVLPSYLLPPIRLLLLRPVQAGMDTSLLPPQQVSHDHLQGTILPSNSPCTTTSSSEQEGGTVSMVMMEDLKGQPLLMHAKAFGTAPTYHDDDEVDYMKEVRRWCYVGPSTHVLVQGMGATTWRCPGVKPGALDLHSIVVGG